MKPEITLDSNVLIYAFSSQDDLKKVTAKRLLLECKKVSIQAINETLYVLLRKFNFEVSELYKVQKFFREKFIVTVMDTDLLSRSLEILDKYSYSYWDSMMLAAAIVNNCDIIYSEDMQNKQIIEGKLEIINPFL